MNELLDSMLNPSRLPSRPGEFHPEPLTEPYVNLSIHTPDFSATFTTVAFDDSGLR